MLVPKPQPFLATHKEFEEASERTKKPNFSLKPQSYNEELASSAFLDIIHKLDKDNNLVFTYGGNNPNSMKALYGTMATRCINNNKIDLPNFEEHLEKRYNKNKNLTKSEVKDLVKKDLTKEMSTWFNEDMINKYKKEGYLS